MARTDSTPGANHLVLGRQIKYASTWAVQTDFVAHLDFSRTYSTRDDIKISPMNADGWREPLSYASEGRIVGSGLYGDFYWQGWLNGDLHYVRGSGSHGTFSVSCPQNVISASKIAGKKNQLMKKMADQKWNAMESLLQARQAVQLLSGKATQLQSALIAAANGRWLSVARILKVKPGKLGVHFKNMSEGWLAFQFGWAPIVSDMADIAITIASFNDENKLTVIGKVSLNAEVEAKVTSSTTLSNVFYGLSTQFNHTDTIKTREEWKASCYASVDLPSLKWFADHGAIGVSTPWAMVPWSFVLDWVLPIGDALAALDARIGLSFRGGSETLFTRTTGQRTTSAVFAPVASHGSWVKNISWSDASSWKMNRIAWQSFPIPQLGYLKDPLGVFEAVTAISLLGSTHKSHWKFGGH